MAFLFYYPCEAGEMYTFSIVIVLSRHIAVGVGGHLPYTSECTFSVTFEDKGLISD